MSDMESKKETYRIRAVRRRDAPIEDRRVADEEIVHELWCRQEELEACLARLLGGGDAKAELKAIYDADGVLVEFAFDVPGADVTDDPPDRSPLVIRAVARVLDGPVGPVAVSASREPPTIDVAAGPGASTAWSQLAPVLATVAAGIGVIGFVTFVGGAVVWARLNAAGFPAAPALGIFPSQDLLVIGAETLVPQVIVALVVVVALTLLYAAATVLIRLLHEDAGTRMHQAAKDAGSGESAVAMFVFIVVALAPMLFLMHEHLSPGELIVGVGVIVVCGLLAALVGTNTRNALYLAATAFLLVGVFEGYVAYSRENSSDHVRGAAIVRDGKKAVVGLFVAEGADRLYLARTSDEDDAPGELDPSRSRLVGIAGDEISDVAIGDRKPMVDALVQAVAMAKELCRLQPKLPPPQSGEIEPCRTAPPGEKQP